MDQILFVLVLLNTLIYPTKTQFTNENTSLEVTPNWLGEFYTTAECDTSKCCCIYGSIRLTKMKPNYLRLESRLVGQTCSDSHPIDSHINMPAGFTTDFFFLPIGQVDLTLTDDSSTITLHYEQASQCDGRALRNTARSIQSIISIQIMLIILILKLIY